MGPIQTFDELRRWFLRRMGLIAMITLVVAALGVGVALNTDRNYRASAVIQVVNPVIDAGESDGTNTVTRRIQAIEQRLMARDNLLALGEAHGMFDGLDLTPTERMLLMRQSVQIEAVAAAQAGFSRDGSLSALIISASARTAEEAASLANALVDDLLRENAETRRDRAQSALRFYRGEEARIEELITQLEAQLGAFQSRNEAFMSGTLTLRREEMSRLTESRLEIEREIVAARGELTSLETAGARGVTLRRQTMLTDLIAQKTSEMAELTRRIDEIQGMFLRGAEIELELSSMNRRMTQLQTQLTSAVERRREAEIGARLEGDDQSERFVLLESALPPDYPISRSRKTIVILATVGGAMLGVGVAYLAEWVNPVLRTSVMFEREMNLRPVVSIPFQMPSRERRRRRMIWGLGLGFPLLAGLALLFALGLV